LFLEALQIAAGRGLDPALDEQIGRLLAASGMGNQVTVRMKRLR
jgi:hypothetical protein